MQRCPLCDSEAAITENAIGKLIDCPNCRVYTLAEKLFDELPKEPDWHRLRSDLATAVRWKFYKIDPVTLPSVMSARLLIERRKEELKSQESTAVDALVGAGPVQEPMHEPIMRLSKKLGLSPEEAFAYVVELLELGIVRIVSLETGRAIPGDQLFPALKAWERGEGNLLSKVAKKGE